MVESTNEFNFSPLKRRKLFNLISEAGFVFVKGTCGDNIYLSNPQKWHPKIEDHCLPVAFMRKFSIKFVNLDEEYFGSYHDKLREIYSSVV